MFFAKKSVDIEKLLSDQEKKANKFLIDNFFDLYDVYYSYDQRTDTMNYYASLKEHDGSTSPYIDRLAVQLKNDGSFVSDSGGSYYRRLESNIFIYKLYKLEDNYSESDEESIYGPVFDEISYLNQFSYNDRQSAMHLREKFDDIVHPQFEKEEEPIRKFSEYMGGKSKLELHIERLCDSDSDVRFSLSVYNSMRHKEFSGEEFINFFQALTLNKELVIRNIPYSISMDDIDDEYRPFLTLLLKTKISVSTDRYFPYSYSYGDSRPVSFLKKDFCNLVFALAGTKNLIYYDSSDALRACSVVDEPEQAYVKIAASGDFAINPELNTSKYDLVTSSDKMVVVDGAKHVIHLYNFGSHQMGKLYKFYLEEGKSSLQFIKRDFTKKLVPVMGMEVLENKNDDKFKFEINIYIDLDDDNKLVTKTIYKVDGIEIDRSKIPSNFYLDACLGAFSKTLSELGIKDNGEESDQGIIYAFLKADLSELRKVAKVYLSDRLAQVKIKSVGTISISVTQSKGWLNATIDSDEYSADELKAILNAYKKKKKYFILKNDVIMLDDDVSKIQNLADELNFDENFKAENVPFFEIFKLQDESTSRIKMKMSQDLQKAVDEIVNFKKEPLKLEKDILSKLRIYQKDAVKWMSVLYRNNLSGILADDMGLGKTFETIAFMSTIEKSKPILIVCPTSLVYNWANEFKLWSPSQKCVTIEGSKEYRSNLIAAISNEEKIVYVTSYDSLRNDLELYKEKMFSLLIIDEAQFIKNASTLKSRAVKKLKSDGRFALTGTPLENRLADLWSIFDFLMPGYLGKYDDFKYDYEIPISEDPKSEKKDNLVKKITPFILRRTKKQVLKSLPPKTVSTVTVNMNEKERKLYVAWLQKARQELGMDVGKISFLATLTKLRQVCVDPSSYFENYKEESSKLSVAQNSIVNCIASGHKVLVFSSFVEAIKNLRKKLKDSGIDSYMICGETKSSDRVEMATAFNTKEDVKVMLVSLKAGGTGLNLIGADTVFIIDPWWNFAAEEQAIDRAHRIGQEKPVNVYKLICYDSIEERVMELQESKKELYDAIIKDGDSGIVHMKNEDYKFIIS